VSDDLGDDAGLTAARDRRATSVLLVEDDADMRTLVRLALAASPGLEVVGEAGDGATALALVEDLTPGIVVLDLGLPDVAGRDLVTRLRQQAPWVRIVLFTGDAEATKSTVAEWGAQDIVRKDGDVSRLVHALEHLADAPLLASTELDRSERSPSTARHFAERTLHGWGCGHLVDDALLVVSELVMNAVIHAATRCRLQLRLASGALRIEVADTGPGSPEPQPIDLTKSSGRGLQIVAAMSSAWGIDPVDGGKVVWAELAS
jgi:DNA-binding response OmpR family regulator